MEAATWFGQLFIFAWCVVMAIVLLAISVNYLFHNEDFPEGIFGLFAAFAAYWLTPEFPTWYGIIGIFAALVGYAYAIKVTNNAQVDTTATFIAIAVGISLVFIWLPVLSLFTAFWLFDVAKERYRFRLPALLPFRSESD